MIAHLAEWLTASAGCAAIMALADVITGTAGWSHRNHNKQGH